MLVPNTKATSPALVAPWTEEITPLNAESAGQLQSGRRLAALQALPVQWCTGHGKRRLETWAHTGGQGSATRVASLGVGHAGEGAASASRLSLCSVAGT